MRASEKYRRCMDIFPARNSTYRWNITHVYHVMTIRIDGVHMARNVALRPIDEVLQHVHWTLYRAINEILHG